MATIVQTETDAVGPEAPEAIQGYFASKPKHWHIVTRPVDDHIVTIDVLANIGKDATPQDRQDMRRVGRVQVFRRNFRLLSSICFASCVMSTWEVLLTASGPALMHGGLPGLFWSMCWSYLGQFFVVLSLAEMASIAPVSSGQYHWVSEFAPPKHQKFLSYICGCLSTICWQSFVTANSYTVGIVIQGIIIINNPSYQPERWHGTLFVYAVTILTAILNVWGAKFLPRMEIVFVACHVLTFFPVLITLLVVAPVKQSAYDVFLHFTDNGGNWPNRGLNVMIGQVAASFILLGSDAPAHLAEETRNASYVVPKSMCWSFVLNIPLTFTMLLAYLFCIGNVQEALETPTGFPFIAVFLSATGSVQHASVLTAIIVLLLFFVSVSTMTSTSRQTFAFARDGGLPFSHWLKQVGDRHHFRNLLLIPLSAQIDPYHVVPVNAIIFTCFYTFALSLINIGSTVAFGAILSLSTSALMATYAAAIGCVAYRKLYAGSDLAPLYAARWSLGKYGSLINGLGFLYACWSLFWSFWPSVYHPTAAEFNWASVILIGLLGLAGLLYVLDKKDTYNSPVAIIRRLA